MNHTKISKIIILLIMATSFMGCNNINNSQERYNYILYPDIVKEKLKKDFEIGTQLFEKCKNGNLIFNNIHISKGSI